MNINENIKEENMPKEKTWSDITIGQYQEIMSIETESEITRFIESVAIILDLDPADIRDLTLKEFKNLQSEMSFLSEQPTADVRKRFELDGVVYALEPDMNLMTAGVFIDAEQFKREPIQNLHRTVALIYRPLISENKSGYKIESHKAEGFEKRAELFRKELSIEVVIGAVFFFSMLGMKLSTPILASLKNKLRATRITKKKLEVLKTGHKKNS